MTDVLRDLGQWDRDIEIWTLETEYGIDDPYVQDVRHRGQKRLARDGAETSSPR